MGQPSHPPRPASRGASSVSASTICAAEWGGVRAGGRHASRRRIQLKSSSTPGRPNKQDGRCARGSRPRPSRLRALQPWSRAFSSPTPSVGERTIDGWRHRRGVSALRCPHLAAHAAKFVGGPEPTEEGIGRSVQRTREALHASGMGQPKPLRITQIHKGHPLLGALLISSSQRSRPYVQTTQRCSAFLVLFLCPGKGRKH